MCRSADAISYSSTLAALSPTQWQHLGGLKIAVLVDVGLKKRPFFGGKNIGQLAEFKDFV